MVSETDKAYLAGFVDGEGYVCIITSRSSFQMEMGVVNTYLSALEELQRLWGGRIYKKKRSSNTHKQAYVLRWYKEVPSILIEILPHLKIKREQARLGIQYALTGDQRGGGGKKRKVSSTVMEMREQIYTKLREANKRGVNIDAR